MTPAPLYGTTFRRWYSQLPRLLSRAIQVEPLVSTWHRPRHVPTLEYINLIEIHLTSQTVKWRFEELSNRSIRYPMSRRPAGLNQ